MYLEQILHNNLKKSLRRGFVFIFAITTTFCLHAQTEHTWVNEGDNANWNNVDSWDPQAVPNSTSAIATFNGSVSPVIVNFSYTVGALHLETAGWTISTNSGKILTLNSAIQKKKTRSIFIFLDN